CGALDRYINTNNVDLLKEAISRYASKMDLETLTAHIQGVKRYIHTIDFYFPKKYDKTSYLFGAVTYTSESEKLTHLAQCLDNLLAEQRKIMKPSSSSKPRRVNKKSNPLS